MRHSRAFSLVLTGALAYTLYSLALYAFFMHFGPLFLAYAWGFGLALSAFVLLVGDLRAEAVPLASLVVMLVRSAPALAGMLRRLSQADRAAARR